jgi:hypothetical protein
MYLDVFYSFAIGFVGAILFVLVDKYEPDGTMARLLKFLVLFVSGVAILHKLKPWVLRCFSQREWGRSRHPSALALHSAIPPVPTGSIASPILGSPSDGVACCAIVSGRSELDRLGHVISSAPTLPRHSDQTPHQAK